MPKFKLGQAVRVIHGSAEPFCGRIAKIEPKPLQFYRVEAQGKDGRTYSMTVEEGWLEADDRPEESCPDVAVQTSCLASSLKSLVFHLGGTHVAGMVDEAMRAARKGQVVKYE